MFEFFASSRSFALNKTFKRTGSRKDEKDQDAKDREDAKRSQGRKGPALCGELVRTLLETPQKRAKKRR